MIRVAARCGFTAVGSRLLPVDAASPFYPLMTDRAMFRATRDALRETGLALNEIEYVDITPDTDVSALEPFFAVGAELGARWAVAAPGDPDLGRLTDRFAALCALAGRYGIGVVLEFFPWTAVRSVAGAMAIVDGSGRDNAGILVDTLHFSRCGATPGDLDAVPPVRMPFIQLCDAPAEPPSTLGAMQHQASTERLGPGEGGLDLKAILRHLPGGTAISLEVPMTALERALGPEAVVRRVIAAARRLLEQ
jgi:sugar phosphate isomerase/epimerase